LCAGKLNVSTEAGASAALKRKGDGLREPKAWICSILQH